MRIYVDIDLHTHAIQDVHANLDASYYMRSAACRDESRLLAGQRPVTDLVAATDCFSQNASK